MNCGIQWLVCLIEWQHNRRNIFTIRYTLVLPIHSFSLLCLLFRNINLELFLPIRKLNVCCNKAKMRIGVISLNSIYCYNNMFMLLPSTFQSIIIQSLIAWMAPFHLANLPTLQPCKQWKQMDKLNGGVQWKQLIELNEWLLVLFALLCVCIQSSNGCNLQIAPFADCRLCLRIAHFIHSPIIIGSFTSLRQKQSGWMDLMNWFEWMEWKQWLIF